MAMSPPEGRGKERTSVGLSLRRKRRFRSRRRLLVAIRISTSPWTSATFCARRAKRWSCAALTLRGEAPEIGGSKITIRVPSNQSLRFKTKREGQPPSRQYSTKLLLLQRGLVGLLLRLHLTRQFQRQLLAARPFVVSAHDALDEVMADDVFLSEIVEENSFHGLEHFSRLKQAATLGVWQVNLRNVTGDHGLGIEAH